MERIAVARVATADPRPVDLARARPEEYEALGAFLNRIRAENLPDDPPIPLEERILFWQNLPGSVVLRVWALWHPRRPEIIGRSELRFREVEENRHAADFHVAVAPEFRRCGLGARLLAPVVADAQREGRTLLLAWTSNSVPSGQAFVQRLGAHMGLALHTNQLEITDLNRDLVRSWRERARERAGGFELLMWEGRVPEEFVEPFARLIDAMNFAPRGELRLEDFHVTPERLRQFMDAEAVRGDQRWRIVAREQATGDLAGYTEVAWHPNRPEFLQQGDTAVLPRFQHLGLGRWLKAAMLEKVSRDRPQVRRIRTGNAVQNAPMLKINWELGFKPYRSESIWQVETSQVQAYLRRQHVSP